jgi:hypothetical protein
MNSESSSPRITTRCPHGALAPGWRRALPARLGRDAIPYPSLQALERRFIQTTARLPANCSLPPISPCMRASVDHRSPRLIMPAPPADCAPRSRTPAPRRLPSRCAPRARPPGGHTIAIRRFHFMTSVTSRTCTPSFNRSESAPAEVQPLRDSRLRTGSRRLARHRSVQQENVDRPLAVGAGCLRDVPARSRAGRGRHRGHEEPWRRLCYLVFQSGAGRRCPCEYGAALGVRSGVHGGYSPCCRVTPRGRRVVPIHCQCSGRLLSERYASRRRRANAPRNTWPPQQVKTVLLWECIP